MTVVQIGTGKVLHEEKKQSENHTLLAHLEDMDSIIAIAAPPEDGEYEMFVTDDLKRFDIIALLELCKIHVVNAHIEEDK
jgi:hypothetical protein